MSGLMTDALAGDECQTVILLRDRLRDLHHIAAHDNCKLVMRALVVDVELDIGKVDDI